MRRGMKGEEAEAERALAETVEIGMGTSPKDPGMKVIPLKLPALVDLLHHHTLR